MIADTLLSPGTLVWILIEEPAPNDTTAVMLCQCRITRSDSVKYTVAEVNGHRAWYCHPGIVHVDKIAALKAAAAYVAGLKRQNKRAVLRATSGL